MTTEQHVIGVDVGLKGVVTLLINGSFRETHDMPVLDTRKKAGKRVDAYGLIALFSRLNAPALIDGTPVRAVVERVHSAPGAGVASMFEFGRSLGIVEAALAAAQIPFDFVEPAIWKRALSVPAAKDGAVARACQLFPQAAHLFRGPRGGLIDGRAEAALIALYGHRNP